MSSNKSNSISTQSIEVIFCLDFQEYAIVRSSISIDADTLPSDILYEVMLIAPILKYLDHLVIQNDLVIITVEGFANCSQLQNFEIRLYDAIYKSNLI